MSALDLLSRNGAKKSALDLLSNHHAPPTQPQVQPNLFEELINRNPYRRGVSWTATGDVGSGKTALMDHIINKLFAHKRQVARELREGRIDEEARWNYEQIAAEKIYWVGDADCQWRRIPESAAGKLFFVEDGLELKFFFDREPVEIKAVPFTDFEDVVAYAQPHKLNVVHIRDPLDVMDFIQYFISESLGEWVTVCVDEMEDICPAYMKEDNWARAQQFSKRMSRARKANISFYATLQSDSQLDWRTPDIVPYRGLCQGARRPKGWKIFEWVCGDVPIGQAHIATRAHFQKITYPPYLEKGTMKVKGLTMWEEIRERTTKAAEKKAENHKEGLSRGLKTTTPLSKPAES